MLDKTLADAVRRFGRLTSNRSYVVLDLVRNPRRTLSTMVGVILGVGLFCGVLFFVDGLSASMTQRAVAPLPLDMQRIVSDRVGASLDFRQSLSSATGPNGEAWRVHLELVNRSGTDANEVTVRSVLRSGLAYVPGSATIDGDPLDDAAGNPFARGPARSGLNVGTLSPGSSVELGFVVTTEDSRAPAEEAVRSSYSTRESVQPIEANRPAPIDIDELARRIAELPGVAEAAPLSIADLGVDAVHHGDRTAAGPAKIFGYDAAYAENDPAIDIVAGAPGDGAVLSAETAEALGVTIGDQVTLDLPDGSNARLPVTGIADLSQARALFSSRRGGDLETFIYVPNSVSVPQRLFTDTVLPAFERAAADGADGRLKTPPVHEVDVTLERELLDADPASALVQTERIARDVMGVAAHQDYLLDNISNTLTVAADDAAVAKRLFVFLGVPGALLAAMLAAYAGNVLAEAQRREQAMLRIRGASRRDLLRMLAARTALLTATGSSIGLVVGYGAAAAVLGRASLERAGAAGLLTSAAIGTAVGFVATGASLYLTGRRTIDREISEDRHRHVDRVPLWRRLWLDVAGLVVVIIRTALALHNDAFAGTGGSVYYGRSVRLNLALLVLPVAVWVAGSLLAARATSRTLAATRPRSGPDLGPLTSALLRRSLGRRPWPIGNAAIMAALIVALATSLAGFTASYDRAKIEDARYANGADIRITPGPTAIDRYGPGDGDRFETASIDASSPVVYGLSNVILRSDRTSDPANLAAIDVSSYQRVAPVDRASAELLEALRRDPEAILVSRDMARFLKARPGDSLHVLLARATPDQAGIDLTIAGLYERLPGFPDGADAVIALDLHSATVPDKTPDFFLVDPSGSDEATFDRAVAELEAGPLAADRLRLDTRNSTLDRDQSSLAALNTAGLVSLDTGFSLAMIVVAIVIFVFGLLLQRRREYVTLRAQGVPAGTIRLLITAEAATVAAAGTVGGVLVGAAMGFYFVAVLRPLFVLDPVYVLPLPAVAPPVVLVVVATVLAAAAGSRLVNALDPTELLRDE